MLRRAPSKSGFFWQGLAIVLPVIVLAGVGLVSLRNDRALARHEARERAQLLAEDLLARLETELTPNPIPGTAVSNSFRIDPGGALLEPMPVAETPDPQPLATERLTTEQDNRPAPAFWLRNGDVIEVPDKE